MNLEWQILTKMTGGRPLVVERVRLLESDVAIEGRFEAPPLLRLTAEDQVFVAAFVRAHGSIKKMEGLFGQSYPSIKNRLRRISDQLDFIETNPAPTRREIIRKLETGEIEVQEALEQLRQEG